MRFKPTLVLFMGGFLWSCIYFTDAENSLLVNSAPASNVKLIVNKNRRLRGAQNQHEEERDVGISNVSHSSQTPGKYKALVKFLVVYWMLVAGVFGVSKIKQRGSSDNAAST
ncbi:secreted RxLR effector peptide protein, putative [Phytophthora infestans T30-4]|uniref:Secreted RxLR effector peptide protein, putative n=1 Tax=Phytophthora infestans (strain T30-4) TaxID=403677 RepID=D0NQF0_PHYIT|nr:secreted RxLR effector peptide protein, putative [Phytophthora infestans T30-4]EEY62882.1 secreted RxLR effector peptide protein, putative [Phytophthora infestans T30-4]|eukprot:XP_002898757.1 secreted RxLR effector peptide protein, putative [Phytophthora infestans T30-4]